MAQLDPPSAEFGSLPRSCSSPPPPCSPRRTHTRPQKRRRRARPGSSGWRLPSRLAVADRDTQGAGGARHAIEHVDGRKRRNPTSAASDHGAGAAEHDDILLAVLGLSTPLTADPATMHCVVVGQDTLVREPPFVLFEVPAPDSDQLAPPFVVHAT